MNIHDAQKLTPEQQRVALAELNGWKWLQIAGVKHPVFAKIPADWCEDFTIIDRPDHWLDLYRNYPPYTTSLDALAEIEAGLSDEPYSAGGGSYYSQRMRYSSVLCQIVNPSMQSGTGFANMYDYITATAEQRAVALITTLSQQHPTE